MEQLEVKVKRQYKGVEIPVYAKPGDAGLDLTSYEVIEADKYISYKTGIAIAIPEGYAGLIFPRSSISNKHMTLANSVGLIDSGYRDEIECRFRKTGNEIYKVGDRIAQLVIIPYPKVILVEVGTLPQEGNRGGGYGSTGK